MKSKTALFLPTLLMFSYLVFANSADSARICVQTQDKKLEQAFNRAVDMALSHVQPSKSGVVDRNFYSNGITLKFRDKQTGKTIEKTGNNKSSLFLLITDCV